MKGIQFVVDGKGKKKAVLIDLEEWGEAWEDIYDVLVSRARRDEPTVSWEELKEELKAELAREEAKAG
jgi:PHD/YefM family antitoxin component YafN of YafNO toxin-antitoxin module